MTLHRLTLKDMRNDLDEFVKYSREFKDDDVNVNTFVHHMHFVLDELERLEEKIEKVSRIADEALSYHMVYGK